MNGLSIYIFNLGILGLISLVCLLIGRPFYKAGNLTFREAFFSIFFGVLFLSTVFAVVKTGGKTIMVGYLILAAFFFFEKRKRPLSILSSHQGSTRFVIIGLMFGAAFVFSWSFLAVVLTGAQFDLFPYHIPGGTAMAPNDYLINVFRSYYLGVTGEENYYNYYNLIDPAYHGPKPYHYLEMWTTASLTSIFGGLAAEKFALLSTPLYHLMAFLGMMALWERYQSIRWYHLLLSAAFLFLAGLHLPFYDQFKILNFSLPIFTHRVKMCVYYPFVFAFLLQFDKEKPQQAILLLSGLMIATVVVAPALLGGVFLFLMYQFYTNKNKRNVLLTGTYVGATVVFIFLFYKFTETGQFNIRANASADNVAANFVSMLTDAPFQKIIFFLTVLLKEAILYLPLLVIVLMLFSTEKKFFHNNLDLIVLVISIVISGAGAYTFFKGEKDATQLFYNIVNSILNCLLIWGSIKLWSTLLKQSSIDSVPWKYYGIGVLLFVIIVKQFSFAVKRNISPAMTTKAYSNEYLQQIKRYVLLTETPNIGAAIKGGKDYNSAFSKQTAAYTLGYYLAYMENGSIALQISDFDIPNLSAADKQDRASSLFYRFVEKQQREKNFSSIGKSQAAFIQKYDLDFVIISKNGTLREEVQSMITDSIIDEISGERFLLVRRR